MSVATRPLLILPAPDGSLGPFSPGGPEFPRPDGRRPRTRAASPQRTSSPTRSPRRSGGGPAVDWEATMAYRRHLWSYGLGVADAMDTAQRGGR